MVTFFRRDAPASSYSEDGTEPCLFPPAYFDDYSFLKPNPSHGATSGDRLCPLQPGNEVVVDKLQDKAPLGAARSIPATAKFNVGYEGLNLRAVVSQSDERIDERERHSCRASHGATPTPPNAAPINAKAVVKVSFPRSAFMSCSANSTISLRRLADDSASQAVAVLEFGK